MRILMIIAVAIFCSSALFSQGSREGTIQVIQDPGIEQLVQKHIRVNETRKGIPGFRVQIFFDSGTKSKIKATSVCEKFRMRHPETDIYLTFISPNYKVRVGDFRTRLDAFRFLQQIERNYPNAYVVTDKINLPKID